MEKIVIIIPTYNEKENISEMIDVLENEIFPKIKNYEVSILVVDDNSPDGTSKAVKEKAKIFNNIKLSTGEKKGLGAAFNRGIKYAVNEMSADAIIKMDADFQHDPEYILDLIRKYSEGNDYVIGSRFVSGGKFPKELGLFRKILSKYGGLCTRIILFFPHINIVSDVSSGLKMLSVKNVLNKVDFMSISSGFYYTTQLLYQAINLGIKVVEIPIEFKLRKAGKTKMPFSNIPGTLKAMLLLRIRRRKIKVTHNFNLR
ncbi:MAG: glycosyltransferase [Candidatus Humimicrobiaceae bacterium]